MSIIMATSTTGATYEGSLPAGVIVKMMVCLSAFAVLIVGFCLVARKSCCAHRPQTSDMIPHMHTPIERGGLVHATAMPSRTNCPRCLADRRLRARVSADRVPLVSSSLSSLSPTTTYPPTPYLSPVPLPPLSGLGLGLGLTGLEEWDEPASPPPAYGAALDDVAFNPH